MLFDIDGTLLTSMRAGVQALTSAGRACVHEAFSLESVEVGGRLDGQIIRDALALLGQRDHHVPAIRSAYEGHLRELLDGGHPVEPLPGVVALLRAIEDRNGWTLGVLTGNYAATGRLKLQAAGIDPHRFAVQVWAEDGETRNCLPKLAMRRCNDNLPSRTVIIGDTTHDIACARACGCLAIAVATGACDHAALRCGQPDLLLDDLSDTSTVMAWLERMSA